MARPESDPIVAKINKALLVERKGIKWRYIDNLKSIKEAIGKEDANLHLLIPRYNQYAIKLMKWDKRMGNMAVAWLEKATVDARMALQARLSNQVLYDHPSIFQPSDLCLFDLSIGSNTYRHLRDDIEIKGILIPILVTDEKLIIDGHYRIVAALELRMGSVPYREVNMRGLSSLTKTFLKLDLGISGNLHRRHMGIEQRKSLKRQIEMARQGGRIAGRPTERERDIRELMGTLGRKGMEESDRQLATLLGVEDENI